MAKPQAQLKIAPEPTTDVVSRTFFLRPWTIYKPEPIERRADEDSRVTILRLSANVTRFRVKKPGDFNRFCPRKDPQVDENLDYHDSKPDIYNGVIGKSYDGFRIAYDDENGFTRIENDGSECKANAADIGRFKSDLAHAALTDADIQRYISEKGLL